MGKKTRKTKKAQSKNERQKEMQHRRGRQLNQAAQRQYDDDQEQIEDASIEILVGDRVFNRNYDLLKEGDSYRGMVKDIVTSMESETIYYYLPINREDKEENRIKLARKDIIRDIYPLCVRFKVGDPVFIRQHTWIPAIINDIYPPDLYASKEREMYPYRVRLLGHNNQFSCVPIDDDHFVIKRPTKVRFKVGDDVLISPSYAEGVSNCYGSAWIHGKIIDLLIVFSIEYCLLLYLLSIIVYCRYR
mmetsp:Transcript_13537/g.16405  ORF Transcript_13537/g.16405 Transcript_13537/m.16405 type:complete len:246 (+) Transcript_13537:593-1330(+)